MAQALNIAFRDGTQIVRAEYFAHNQRIQKLLEKLGGTVCDYISCGSIQDGIPIDWKVTEIRNGDFFRTISESRVNTKSINPPEDLQAHA